MAIQAITGVGSELCKKVIEFPQCFSEQMIRTHMCGFWKGSPAVFRVILEVVLTGGLAKFNFRALRLPDRGGRDTNTLRQLEDKVACVFCSGCHRMMMMTSITKPWKMWEETRVD